MAIAQNLHATQPICPYDLREIKGLFKEKPKGIQYVY